MLITAEAANRQIALIQNALKIFTALQLTVDQYPGQSYVSNGDSYDYIIVGGGTAGSVIANRLVEDRQVSVLLIEAGGIPEDETNIPNMMLFLKQSDATWNYTVEESGLSRKYQRSLKDEMSLGRVLGGTSSVSYLLYNPRNRYDYNSWAATVNDPNWNWDNILPYLQKSQKLLDPILANTENGKLYGKRGEIGLTLSRYSVREKLFKALEQMGNERVDSFNGNVSVGCADAVFTLADGIRQSTANTYLSPIRYKPNLHVLINTVAKRIIFDAHKNAVAVEVETEDKRNIIIKARKEIILSAGIVNSPKILMLSGIGPKEHLSRHNIDTKVNLPVGRNLQDHMSVVVVYNMTKLVTPFIPWNPHKYPASVIFSSTALNKNDELPDYQTVNYINYPFYLMMYCTFSYGYIDKICNNMIKTDTNSVMLYSVVSKQTFKSRGKVLLRSPNFKDNPLVFPDYYTNEEDVDDHARAVEDFVKIANTDQFKKMGARFKDPGLDSCKNFKKYGRRYWKCYVKSMATSLHYYSGTCSMGSVVDSRLRVFGVKRLRVADASVMPAPTAGGTLAATIMIGEKVSDMIKEDNRDIRQKGKLNFSLF